MLIKPKHLPQRTNYATMAWNHELIGDPFGGPASGSREKGGGGGLGSVLGIVAAVASVATGWGMIANAGLSLTSGALVAGGVMQGIGTITGNAKLAKIGGTLSLVGGIGSMVGDVSAAMDGGASLTDALGSAGSSMRDGLNDSLGKIKEAWEGVATAGQSTPTIDVNAPTGGLGSESLTKDAIEQSNIGQSVATPAAQGNGLISSSSVGMKPVGDLGMQSNGLSLYSPSQAAGGPLAASANLGSRAASQGGGLLSTASQWLKENPYMTFLAGQGLSGAMGGIANYQAAKDQSTMAEQILSAKQEDKARELANINGGYLFLDPSSANYATAKANATSMGVKTMDLPRVNSNVQLTQNGRPINQRPSAIQPQTYQFAGA